MAASAKILPRFPVPLRKFLTSKAPSRRDEAGAKPKPLWRQGLLVVSSAALGGIAVAIWNRRTLAQMRQDIDSDETAE
jgi:hypothetical protein